MSDAAVAGLKELAEPWPSGSKVKEAIERAAKRVLIPHAGKVERLSYWRAFDIWYRKARRIEQYEVDAIAEAIEKKRREAARNEFHELRTRLARLEAMFVQSDPDFHRENIDLVRGQVRQMGGAGGAANSTVDRVKVRN